jgi:hypothetical protein
MAAVNYTNAVNVNISPSCRVATLVSGTGPRILRTLVVFPRIKAMFHHQFAARYIYFSELSWWLDRKHLLILRWCNIMKACDVCHYF